MTTAYFLTLTSTALFTWQCGSSKDRCTKVDTFKPANLLHTWEDFKRWGETADDCILWLDSGGKKRMIIYEDGGWRGCFLGD